jgi:hypothetical protein
VGESFKDWEGRYRATGLEAGDRGLGHCGGGELGLTPAMAFAKFSRGAAEFVSESEYARTMEVVDRTPESVVSSEP